VRARLVVLALVLLSACAHNQAGEADQDEEPTHEPIHVHVRNENFLDMTISVVSSGVARRLGQVTGNGVGDFTFDFNLANGRSIQVRATPIGGPAPWTSPNLSVGSGQLIDMRIAGALRQSNAVIREP
jgi:type IV pilus biogenesis protein CpaD/CtpE